MRQKDIDWLVEVWRRDVAHVPAEQAEGYRYALGAVWSELSRWDLTGLDLSRLDALVKDLERATPCRSCVTVRMWGGPVEGERVCTRGPHCRPQDATDEQWAAARPGTPQDAPGG